MAKSISLLEYTAIKVRAALNMINDLRVLLADPLTQASVLEALKAESGDDGQFLKLKSFLQALIEIVLHCHQQSVFVEMHPSAAKLCATAVKVAKLLLA